MEIAEPHKELRFTRAGQAVPFWVAAAVCAAGAVLLLSIATQRHANPDLPHHLWALIPVALCWLFARAAVHCTRHAYLILSPLGVEIFPLFRPAKGMRMIPWANVESFEAGSRVVTLHFRGDTPGGVHLTLSPILRNQRPLLVKALEGRLKRGGPEVDSVDG